MTYIENIFICIAIPLILCLFFRDGKDRKFTFFVIVGMLTCLLSAYVSSFFMGYYGADQVTAVIELTPVCEEVMKVLPLLFYLAVFEPEKRSIVSAAVGIAAGFATFENVCYLTENGAENFSVLLIRGISAGALHILCGIAMGYGIAYVFRKKWIRLTGTVGTLGACVIFHGVYNLLISGGGSWTTAGYLFPSALILLLYILKQIFSRLKITIE